MKCFILGFHIPYKNQSAIARDFLRAGHYRVKGHKPEPHGGFFGKKKGGSP
jgi:hypothetical protein